MGAILLYPSTRNTWNQINQLCSDDTFSIAWQGCFFRAGQKCIVPRFLFEMYKPPFQMGCLLLTSWLRLNQLLRCCWLHVVTLFLTSGCEKKKTLNPPGNDQIFHQTGKRIRWFSGSGKCEEGSAPLLTWEQKLPGKPCYSRQCLLWCFHMPVTRRFTWNVACG